MFYTAALGLFSYAAYLAGAQWITAAALAVIGVHFVWQIVTLDTTDTANCLKRFKSNRDVGLLLTVSILIDMLSR